MLPALFLSSLATILPWSVGQQIVSRSATAPLSVPCTDGIRDSLDPSVCIGASRIPTLGSLFPLSPELFVDASGHVGIGTTSPLYPLHVSGSMEAYIPSGHLRVNNYSASSVPSWELRHADARNTWLCYAKTPATSGGDGDLYIRSRAGPSAGKGTVRIEGMGSDTVDLLVDGDVSTRALTVRGADLAEGFRVVPEGRAPGTLLIVDPAGSGQLLPSSAPYQKQVIGVVSGAGGIRPGLQLAQEGVSDHDTRVAMVGQVYVWCSDEAGPIAPGDLITTSSTAGHGMRASDPGRAFGAVVGKALQPLTGQAGLVLVLINLQ